MACENISLVSPQRPHFAHKFSRNTLPQWRQRDRNMGGRGGSAKAKGIKEQRQGMNEEECPPLYQTNGVGRVWVKCKVRVFEVVICEVSFEVCRGYWSATSREPRSLLVM